MNTIEFPNGLSRHGNTSQYIIDAWNSSEFFLSSGGLVRDDLPVIQITGIKKDRYQAALLTSEKSLRVFVPENANVRDEDSDWIVSYNDSVFLRNFVVPGINTTVKAPRYNPTIGLTRISEVENNDRKVKTYNLELDFSGENLELRRYSTKDLARLKREFK